jgi:hypothetical protein
LNDRELTAELRLDISTAMSALRNGEWKAAAVMSGSVAEALLLWALQRHEQEDVNAVVKRSKPLEQWDLAEYIEVADHLHCIEAGTPSRCNEPKSVGI